MWEPISREEFENLFEEQFSELTDRERQVFEQYQIPIETATIHRTAEAGGEVVFVVARYRGGVLYFDDVEEGFNLSSIDSSGRILRPGGSQYTLREAVIRWMMGKEDSTDPA